MHYIITALGCKVNQYEAQAIETLLHPHGFTAAGEGDPVDLIVVNTCAVTAEGGQKLTFVNEYGTLVLDPSTGRYSFELNSDSDAVRAMKPGELYEIRFDVTVRDHDDKENTGQIVVNIKGTNTAPEIDADVSIFGNAADAPIREDAAGADATFSGIIAAGDVDGDEGDRLGYGFALTEDQKADGWRVSPDGKTLTTTYGTVRLNDSGEYVYTLDSKRADGLAEGKGRRKASGLW